MQVAKSTDQSNTHNYGLGKRRMRFNLYDGIVATLLLALIGIFAFATLRHVANRPSPPLALQQPEVAISFAHSKGSK